MRPEPFPSAASPGTLVGMSSREVAQSHSTKARRSLDGALIGFIVAVMVAVGLGGSGILH